MDFEVRLPWLILPVAQAKADLHAMSGARAVWQAGVSRQEQD